MPWYNERKVRRSTKLYFFMIAPALAYMKLMGILFDIEITQALNGDPLDKTE